MSSPSASAVKGVCGAGLRWFGRPAVELAPLVSHQVEREIEQRYGKDRSDGKR